MEIDMEIELKMVGIVMMYDSVCLFTKKMAP